MNQGERLAKMEAILERIETDMGTVKLDVAAVKAELSADKADLAALKNRGLGLLASVGVIATLIGLKIDAILKALAEALK